MASGEFWRMMFKYVVGFLLVMHGLAHGAGLVGLWTSGAQAFADQAWVFSGGITAHSAVGRMWGLLWLLAGVGLVGAGLGLLFGQAWWPTLAVAAAAVSLAAIVPWFRVVPPGAYAGALLDLLIMALLLSPWAGPVLQAR